MEREEGAASGGSVGAALRPLLELNQEAVPAGPWEADRPAGKQAPLSICHFQQPLARLMLKRSGCGARLLQLIALAAEHGRALVQSLETVTDGLQLLQDRAEQLLGGGGG